MSPSVYLPAGFEPCLNCAKDIDRAALLHELTRYRCGRVHLDVSPVGEDSAFALSPSSLSGFLRRLPLPSSVHLWPPYSQIENLGVRGGDTVFVHGGADPLSVIDSVRRGARRADVGLVVDSPAVLDSTRRLLAGAVREILVLAIPLGGRGLAPSSWAIDVLGELAKTKEEVPFEIGRAHV